MQVMETAFTNLSRIIFGIDVPISRVRNRSGNADTVTYRNGEEHYALQTICNSGEGWTLMGNMVLLVYLAPMLIIWTVYLGWRNTRHRVAIRLRDESIEAGLDQPASLHPVIDMHRCIGCRSCVSTCPENNVLGIINDKAELVSPANCIGHGACKTACPMSAITLVFGTSERGVDIPLVAPDFETNVPGIFIAGELGGMGLIRNAIEQGRQAMQSIVRHCRDKAGHELDVVIVGAGPAGLSATLSAMEHKLRYVTVEQDSVGGTVSHFPRGKVVMTAPVNLPVVGMIRFREISKEALLGFWEDVIRNTGARISFSERVESIAPAANGIEVRTTQGNYRSSCVLLAIGRRGTPRKLGVPGEESGKVVYRLTDPGQYRNSKVLVVGGGDSALEAAASIAELPDAQVTLSYRRNAFSRCKQKNRERIAEMQQNGSVKLLMNSRVKAIHSDKVDIEQDGAHLELVNDAVIVCAGGILPTPFLKEIGIKVDTKYGTR
jgi:thioredoxin reductase (NADPH)